MIIFLGVSEIKARACLAHVPTFIIRGVDLKERFKLLLHFTGCYEIFMLEKSSILHK